MSKKETEDMLQIALNFIQGLTNEQYENILKGNASIDYIIENNHPQFGQLKERIIREARGINDTEKILKKYTKKYLASFCEHSSIDIKARDTKAIIYQKVASHFQFDTESADNDGEKFEENKIANIGAELQNFDSLDEAREFLVNHDLLRTKTNLVKLARSLDVYIKQSQSKQAVRNRIVDSVVGSRIRSKVIRAE